MNEKLLITLALAVLGIFVAGVVALSLFCAAVVGEGLKSVMGWDQHGSITMLSGFAVSAVVFLKFGPWLFDKIMSMLPGSDDRADR